MAAVPVLAKTVRDSRRTTIGWSVGLAVVTAIYGSAWASMDPESIAASADALPEGLSEAMGFEALSDAAGYLAGTVYGILVPLLLTGFAIAFAARLIAGDEEAGILDLYLARPIGRRRFLIERWAALAAVVLVVGIVVWLVMAGLDVGTDMAIGAGPLAGATAATALLALLFGTLALAVSGFRGRRATVLSLTGVVAVLTYLVNALHGQVEALDAIAWISPWYYLDAATVLREGTAFGNLAVLAAATLVLGAVGVWAIERRDLGT